jgi:hypothetical protein
VRYDWNVDGMHPLTRYIAPFMRPAINWNHDVVTDWGRKGVIRALGCGGG